MKDNKELLFKDLSARIPYHVRVKVWLKDGTTEEGPLDLQHNYADVLLSAFYYNKIVDIKPYLRPISSMTEEEDKKRIELGIWINTIKGDKVTAIDKNVDEALDWLNAHHFDYRGLIEKGLALEAPEGMYDLKKK